MKLTHFYSSFLFIALSLLISGSVAMANDNNSPNPGGSIITEENINAYYQSVEKCKELYQNATTEQDFKLFQYCQQATGLEQFKTNLVNLCGDNCETDISVGVNLDFSKPNESGTAAPKQNVEPLPSTIIPIKNKNKNSSFNWLFN